MNPLVSLVGFDWSEFILEVYLLCFFDWSPFLVHGQMSLRRNDKTQVLRQGQGFVVST